MRLKAGPCGAEYDSGVSSTVYSVSDETKEPKKAFPKEPKKTFPKTFDYIPNATNTSTPKASFSRKSYFDILSTDSQFDEDFPVLVSNINPEVNDNTEWEKVVSKQVKKAVNKSETVLKPHVNTTSSMINRTAGESCRPMEIGMVDYEGKSKLRKSDSGKITIDSGAGESVCPVYMVPEEPIHKTDKIATRYRAAGGQTLINKGENVSISKLERKLIR